MATRNTNRQTAALVTARERRRALDRERDERDQRVEQTTAQALLVLDRRNSIEQELEAVTVDLGNVLRSLLSEDLTADRVAALVDLEVTEVRRLTRSATAHRTEKNGTTDNQEPHDPPLPTELTAAPPAAVGDSAKRWTD